MALNLLEAMAPSDKLSKATNSSGRKRKHSETEYGDGSMVGSKKKRAPAAPPRHELAAARGRGNGGGYYQPSFTHDKRRGRGFGGNVG
jgi:hypothetical protein